jgi:hypothetical protein
MMTQFLYGINVAGAEYGEDWSGWTNQTYFAWRTPAQLTSEMTYFGSKGFNCFRLPIAWERLQHTLLGALDTTYQTNLINYVNQATAAGYTVIVDLHNYNRYAVGAFTSSGSQSSSYTQHVLGDGTLTNAHLIDVWSKLSKLFLGNTKVIFELMNEPHDFSITSTNYFAMINDQIAAIRATGATQLILVPNSRASDVDHWSSYAPNGGPVDAIAALAVKDSLNNFAYAMHAYQDNPTSATSYSTLLTEVTNWAKTNGKKLFLTEMGSTSTAANGAVGVAGALQYMNANSDVWMGWVPWNLAPYLLTPDSNYTTDGPSMAWYTPYIGKATVITPPVVVPPVVVVPKVIPSMTATSSQYAAPGDQGFTSTKVVPDGYTVAKGTYNLNAATRTTYGDDSSVSVDIILSNPNAGYDITWSSMTVDLRGATIGGYWNCTITGTSGVVTITPTADTKLVRAKNTNAIGFNFNRSSNTAQKNYQVLVKSIAW